VTPPKTPVLPQEDPTFGDIVWTQFRRNRPALASLAFVALVGLLAAVAPVLASSRPFVWREAGSTEFPWFSSLFDRNLFESPVDVFWNVVLVFGLPGLGLWAFLVRRRRRQAVSRRRRHQRAARQLLLLGGALLVLTGALLLWGTGQPYHRYGEREVAAQVAGRPVDAIWPPIRVMHRDTGFPALEGPSSRHWLGVDQSTRDVAVRLLYGTRISLTIGVVAVAIYLVIGVVLGSVGGYFGGGWDIAVQRLVEIMMSLPTFFVVLTLVAFIDRPSIFHIMAIIGLVNWTGVARLVRAEFLRLRKLDFVTAAVALGYPTRRIIFGQVLPNALGPVLVSATFGVASAILVESTLSFLGLGDLSAPSWGQTLQEGYASGAWHLILAPGFAIFLTVSALNLVGEGLRDALDPKLRQ
jgi:peptide/nickel transport system permease protein